jgi:flagellar assembly protein FliH
MRSQSEKRTAAVPFHLQEGAPRRDGTVARLEFQGVNRTPVPPVTVEPPLAADTTSCVEVEALKEELRRETEQFQARLEEAQRKAADANRLECSAEFALGLAAERERIAKFWAQFDRERSNYFATAEAEVVRLALAIAGQVLHREVRLDPLLLRGVVRVTLESIRDAGIVMLRVPVSEADAWKECFAEIRDASLQIIGDEDLERGDCLVESNAGSVNLGVQAQLSEIERGFFDLLEKRPA